MSSGFVYSIPTDFYISVQNRIIEVLRDEYPSGYIPAVTVEGEPYVARIPYMSDEDVSKGVLDWDVDQKAANAGLKYLDVNIAGRQMTLAFSSSDLRRSGAEVIGAKQNSIINKFANEVDKAVFHGNVEGVTTLSSGLISQCTDFNAKLTNVAQTTGVIVFGNAKAMYQGIPAKYRSKYPVVLLMDWKSYDLLGSTIGVTGMTISGLQTFNAMYPNCTIVPTNSILASGDTEGTHGRMVIFVQNQDVVRKIIAKDIAPCGPAIIQLDGGVKQLWGALFAVKVIQATACGYTGTQLTF